MDTPRYKCSLPEKLPSQPWQAYGPFTVFDLETTGLSAVKCRIVEVAALRVERDGTTSSFYTLVHPRCPIPPQARMIHGIRDEDVADAPAFHEIAAPFHAFIHGSTLVAHNAMFDLAFIQESFARCGQPLFKGRTLDTIRLYRKLYPDLGSYKLQNLRARFNFGSGIELAHSAMDDVKITLEAFAHVMNQLVQAENEQ